VSLVEQWQRLEKDLDPNWSEARVRLEVGLHANRAAALLGPLNPGRRGHELRFHVARDGSAPGPEAVRRLLRKLDAEGIVGYVALVDVTRAEEAGPGHARPTLAESWDAALATLPPDWSDLWAEVRLDSSDYLERAALRSAPLNPRAGGDRATLRFRAASRFGYGASTGMVRRCLERCDEDGIRGTVQVLCVLSDTLPVQTQGPVRYVDGGPV
jgi:hypothetical protein